MAVTIQTRRDDSVDWTTANPVLALGEIGIETDTDKAKYGDGFTAWNDLEYWDLGADGGQLPAGTNGQVLRYGASWEATSDLVVDDAGNVGIGAPTANERLTVHSDGFYQFSLNNSAGNLFAIGVNTNNVSFYNNGAERMRIDSSGRLLVGYTAATGNGERFGVKQSFASTWTSLLENANGSSPFGLKIDYSAAAPNGTSNFFLQCEDSSATRVQFRSNGGLANFSANNANISDRRSKKDEVIAGNYLDKICAIPVKNFRYKDQEGGKHHLGVIAQDVELVAPEFVSKASFDYMGEDMDSVHNTDLMFAMMKAIQEQQEQIDELRALIEAQ